MRRAIVAAAAVAALATSAAGAATGPSDPGEPSANRAKRCQKAIVGGELACVKVRDRCKRKFESDYNVAGLTCRRGKLRKAAQEDLPGGPPYPLEPDGTMSFETALDVVDAGVVDLPGIETGQAGLDELIDASTALVVVRAHEAELTPEQQTAFDAATNPDQPQFEGRQATSERNQLQRYINDAVAAFQAEGYQFTKPIRLILLPDQGSATSTVLAYVTGDDLLTSPTCNLFVTARGRAQGLEYKRAIIAHEVTHCAQHAFYNYQALAAAPDWLIEGSAMWMGWRIANRYGVDPPFPSGWDPWLRFPNATDLFLRSYDAVGFFSILDQGDVDVFARGRAAFAADSAGDSNDAYGALIEGAPNDVLDRWGPGFARNRTLGQIWDLDGPGIVPSQEPYSISPGSDVDGIGAAPRSGVAAELRLQFPIFSLKVSDKARGFLRDGAGRRQRLATGTYTISRERIRCRTGRPANLPVVEPGNVHIGFRAEHKFSYVLVQGMSKQDYCRGRRPRPPRPGATCITPGSSPAARREEQCAYQLPGITIYAGEEDPQAVANFPSGNCSYGDDGFLATAGAGGWELEVSLESFLGFDQYYGLTFGDLRNQVLITGPMGTFGNQTSVPSSEGPAPSGTVYLQPTADLGLGAVALDEPAENGVIAAGVMDCVYPDDE